MSQPLSQDSILPWIFHIRGRRVILDIHIAALYGVQTRALKQQVRRNIERFPDDFMFELTAAEWEEVITNCDNPRSAGSFKSRFPAEIEAYFVIQRTAVDSILANSQRSGVV